MFSDLDRTSKMAEMMQEIQKVNSMSTGTESETVETVSISQEVQEYEEETFFQDIYLLADNGISLEDVELLKNSGINTIKGVQMTIRPKLLDIKGFTKEKVDHIKEVCSKIVICNDFKTAFEMCEERKLIFNIPTGSLNLDKLLDGGIESMSITEFFGESRTGKTQIAHTFCVSAQIPRPDDGYPGGKVMYIDTENTFRPERIRQIAHRFELNDKQVLQNILCARAYNSEHQYELLKNVAAKFHEEPGVFKLLVMDSIMAQFKVDFIGTNHLVKRQQKLNKLLSRLQKISEEYNVAVYITNHITSDFKYPMLGLEHERPKPTGGNILAHASTTRVALKNNVTGIGNKRVAILYDSPKLAECETTFAITVGGIRDPPIDIE